MKLKSLGKLIAMDMYNCSDASLQDPGAVAEILNEKVVACGLEPRQTISNHEEGTQEFFIGEACKQGHVLMHLYPEVGFVCIDVFTRLNKAEPDKLAHELRQYFAPDKTKITYLNRGDFGTLADMKPRHYRNTKTMRRMRTMGGALNRTFTRIILKPKSM